MEATSSDAVTCNLCSPPGQLTVGTIAEHLVVEHGIDPADIVNAPIVDGTGPATFNELGRQMQAILELTRAEAGRSEAGRDFALAATHLEDTLTRYNSGRYRAMGTWKRADPDRPPS